MNNKKTILILLLSILLVVCCIFAYSIYSNHQSNYYNTKIEVEDLNMHNINLMDEWIKLKNDLDILGDARLDDIQINFDKDGKISFFRMHVLVDHKNNFMSYEVYNLGNKYYSINVFKSEDEYIQYKSSERVKDVFEKFNGINLMDLIHDEKYPKFFFKYKGYGNYSGSNIDKYLLGEENRLITLDNNKMPFEGHAFTIICNDHEFQSDKQILFFFNVNE